MAGDRLRLAHLAMLRERAESLREEAGPLAGGADAFSHSGLEYLLALVQRAAAQGKGYRDLRAEELCRAFARAAAQDFGPFLPDALDRFGIRTGADLGRAVFLLAAQGCLALREGETLEEYAACGRLGDGV
jgi:uncharacterized repeat protein (TIGR04138 family)